MQPKPIYVETLIRASLDEVWAATQDPRRHRDWDLRFTDIDYLPKATADARQHFRYATRIGFGLRIEGRGESVGDRTGEAGERTSVLRFWSDDWKSLIRTGGGYWRYLPEAEGVRFLTLYSYQTRFGLAGAFIDRCCFRPLLGWATAWSFDCLRLTLEKSVPAGRLWAETIAALVARVVLAAVWIYHGLVPKLLFPDSGELAILRGAAVFGGHECAVLRVLGLAEIGFGAALLFWNHSKRLLWINAGLLMVLLAGAAVSQPALLVAPFGPVTLTMALLGLTSIELVLRRHELPAASGCRRTPPSGHLPLT